MNIVDIIIKKRDGEKLTPEEIAFFVKGVTDNTLPDYQISALLMAICLQSMDVEETACLTMEMANSGAIADFSAVEGFKTDKHSTGGVADTTTLILAPLVAACDIPVVKMSGRGLGFSGGTLDKLESIPGFSVDVSEEDAIAYARKSNIVIMGQTADLAPADKTLYALRDVTGTVDSIALIAASVMSKKIAAGSDGIVLDVKCGNGAFMKDLESAKALANVMASMGAHMGRKITAVISSMEQPLGLNIGNSLEVIEAIEVLKGNVTGDLLDVSLTLGAQMLLLAEKVTTEEDGKAMLLEKIADGSGLNKFHLLLEQQGGDVNIIKDYSLLPLSPCSATLFSDKTGYITHMDTALIGRASQETGAGRLTKEDELDFGAGIIMKKRLGDPVKKGEQIAILFSKTDDKCKRAVEFLRDAIEIGDAQPAPLPLILEIIKE